MSRSHSWMQDLDSAADEPRAPRHPWVELACLLCGEVVGVLLDHRVIRPRAEGSVLLNAQTMRCGRCGGPVVAGNRGDDALRDKGAPGTPESWSRAD